MTRLPSHAEGAPEPGGKRFWHWLTGASSSAPGAGVDPAVLWQRAACGFILGFLLWPPAQDLGVQVIPILRGRSDMLFLCGLFGAAVAVTRFRRLLWVAGGTLILTLLFIAYSPVLPPLVRSLVRKDVLQPVEAVVVLSSDIRKNGDLTTAAQGRLLRGYELVHQGMGKRLIVTRLQPPKLPYLPTVQRQMDMLGLSFPVEEVGPVTNTHDEALIIGKLAKERGWSRVILVSDSTHMRRASAVFRKAGVDVLCAPCAERDYDPYDLTSPGERRRAFGDWLWETLGYYIYQRNGWI